jgi:hypothetical protein
MALNSNRSEKPDTKAIASKNSKLGFGKSMMPEKRKTETTIAEIIESDSRAKVRSQLGG